MRGTTYTNGGPNSPSKAGVRRKRLVVGALLLAALLLAATFAFKTLKSSPAPRQPVAPAPVAELDSPPVPKPAPATQVVARPTPAPPKPVEPAALQPGPASARQLVAELVELNGASGPITPEQAERFKQNLAELVRQGAAAVPAIREFLEKNQEVYYGEVAGGEQLGYASLRAGLIDALKQIGGPEAQGALLQALQTTAMPSELLALASGLDQEAPGPHRDEILNAARETLAMAATNQLGTNIEVGPAFRMLGTFGGDNTVADVAKNDPATFYNALSLANLPNGQGLPALIQMAENSGSGPQGVATEMIAQMAGENADALEALVKMAQKGQIANRVWVRLAPILGGDQYQISGSGAPNAGGEAGASGGQSYAVINVATTPEQINQRIALIDGLLGFVGGDSAAAAALREERGVLMGKLGK